MDQYPSDPAYQQLAGPERSSVMAIVSFIVSVISMVTCCVPLIGGVLGTIAIVGSSISMISIRRSDGRLGGTGLAVAGLILGIIATFLNVATIIGVNTAVQGFNADMSALMTAMEAKDWDAARTVLSAEPGHSATDQEFELFYDAYHAAHGDFDATAKGLGEFFPLWAGAAKSISNPPQGQNLMPWPVRFANGPTLLFIHFDQGSSAWPPDFANIGFVAPGDSRVVWLTTNYAGGPASVPSVTPPPGEGDQPEEGDTPEDDRSDDDSPAGSGDEESGEG